MDISLAAHAPETYWEPSGESQYWETQWNHVDALGKGKGGKGKGGYGKATGKGFNGVCYACGEPGHTARECPNGKGGYGKAKGKGKTLICWSCGEEGHPQWMCPLNKGKGKGKGKQYGKGGAKGTYSVDEWEHIQQFQDQETGEADVRQGFGGGEINEVETWRVKVNKARGNRDMRPQVAKPMMRKPSMTKTNNMFGNLQESDDEDEETSEQSMQAIRRVPRWVKVNQGMEIASVEVNRPRDIGAVTHTDGEWERIPVKIDSGAIDTVMPPTVAKYFDTVQTEMSKKGPGFRAANGSPIKHYGKKVINGIGDRYQPLNMTAQVADVKTTLASVNQMLKAGNRVHSETGNCYVEDIRTGMKTRIEEKGGTFEVGIWVPTANDNHQCDHVETSGNRQCSQMETARENPKASFHRQDEER